MMAHSPHDMRILQFFRKSIRFSTFSLLQQPPSMSPMSHCLVNFLMSSIGDLLNSTRSMSCRIRSSMSRMDMWQPKQPASDAVATTGLLIICPPSFRIFSISLPMGALSYLRLPMGTANPISFFRMAPTGHWSMAFCAWSSDISPRAPGSATIVDLPGAARHGPKMCLPSFVVMPRTQRRHWMHRLLSIMIFGPAGVDFLLREQVGEARRPASGTGSPGPAARSSRSSRRSGTCGCPRRRASRRGPCACPRGRVRRSPRSCPPLTGRGAGGHVAAADPDGADAAAAGRLEPLVAAERRGCRRRCPWPPRRWSGRPGLCIRFRRW